MSTQWHPLFSHLLRLQLDPYYRVETEVPTGELPRRGDITVLRRNDGPEPPFNGLWSNLTEWNVFEYKGPTDDAEEADLDLLLHVGTGIAYRWNEERRERGEAAMPNRRVSFWYLAPLLSEAFLDKARTRIDLVYEPFGVWRGRVYGHPMFLVNCRELAVEIDAIPLLMARREPPPLALGQLLARHEELWRQFGTWMNTLHPALWEEVLKMGVKTEGGPPLHMDHLIRVYGLSSILEGIGNEVLKMGVKTEGGPPLHMDHLIRVYGLPGILEGIGTAGREALLKELLAGMSAEQVQALLRNLPENESKQPPPK